MVELCNNKVNFHVHHGGKRETSQTLQLTEFQMFISQRAPERRERALLRNVGSRRPTRLTRWHTPLPAGPRPHFPAAQLSGKASLHCQPGVRKMADVQPPPLRSLDDFLLSSARFAVPDVRDLDRWNNRIINNLLYYQSNYFLSAALLLLLVG